MATAAAQTSIYAFQKNPTMVDYPGRLAAMFFTSGCNFRCGFCHNASLLAEKQEGITLERLEEACENFADQWVDAAVISGGEPTMAPDLPVIAGLFRSFGFKVKLDTNGSNPRVLERMLGQLDYLAMDVKCSLEQYHGLTGFGAVERVGESIALLKESRVACEFRTTVIEPFHTDEEMRKIGELIRGARRYVLQPFVPRDDLPDEALRSTPRTSPDRMREVAEMMAPYAEQVVCIGFGRRGGSRRLVRQAVGEQVGQCRGGNEQADDHNHADHGDARDADERDHAAVCPRRPRRHGLRSGGPEDQQLPTICSSHNLCVSGGGLRGRHAGVDEDGGDDAESGAEQDFHAGMSEELDQFLLGQVMFLEQFFDHLVDQLGLLAGGTPDALSVDHYDEREGEGQRENRGIESFDEADGGGDRHDGSGVGTGHAPESEQEPGVEFAVLRQVDQQFCELGDEPCRDSRPDRRIPVPCTRALHDATENYRVSGSK